MDSVISGELVVDSLAHKKKLKLEEFVQKSHCHTAHQTFAMHMKTYPSFHGTALSYTANCIE